MININRITTTIIITIHLYRYTILQYQSHQELIAITYRITCHQFGAR